MTPGPRHAALQSIFTNAKVMTTIENKAKAPLVRIASVVASINALVLTLPTTPVRKEVRRG